MNILDGKMVSNKILEDIKEKIDYHVNNKHLGYKLQRPSIGIVMVGNNPASEVYVKHKIKACKKAGINYNLLRFDEDVKTHDLYREVQMLNKSHFSGYIIQLPLPSHINPESILDTIDPDKDIDGFHPTNFGKMSLGKKAMRPATPYGILKLLQHYQIETKGKKVVVVGRSNIVGKPISIMLGNDFDIGRATVTSCDINTPKSLLNSECKKADIIVVAVGKPNLITEDMVKEGAIVIDVGINRLEDGSLVGDVDFENVSKKVSWITPVPGGVGPMTIAGLILNTYSAWKEKNFIHED